MFLRLNQNGWFFQTVHKIPGDLLKSVGIDAELQSFHEYMPCVRGTFDKIYKIFEDSMVEFTGAGSHDGVCTWVFVLFIKISEFTVVRNRVGFK